ncbi:MAG TPA: hypothetical protein VF498_02055 [Anaerolineales bacterium]
MISLRCDLDHDPALGPPVKVFGSLQIQDDAAVGGRQPGRGDAARSAPCRGGSRPRLWSWNERGRQGVLWRSWRVSWRSIGQEA